MEILNLFESNHSNNLLFLEISFCLLKYVRYIKIRYFNNGRHEFMNI